MTILLKKNPKNAAKTAKALAREAEIIAGIGRIIGSTLNIEEVYERFADEAKKLIPFDRVAINLINSRDRTITASYESGLNIPGRKIGNIHPLKKSFNELIFQTRMAQMLHPASLPELKNQFPQMAVLFRVGLRSIMGAPLISGNRVIGTLQFRSKKPNAYNDHYGKLAERIANQIAGAIANAQLFLERERTERALKKSERQLHLLSSHLLTAQETERKRISMELHDELGQALTLLKLRISFVEKRLQKSQRVLSEECEHTLQYIDQIIENVRRLSRDLRPPMLEDFGLVSALHRLASEFSRRYQIQTHVEAEEINSVIPLNSQVMIYRIVQEAMTNIRKHAQASQVRILARKRGGRVHFFVEDDGKGFSLQYIKALKEEEKGLGLVSMEERVRVLGGSFEIRSQKKTGTRISFTIPAKMKGTR
jgi:signal transduction histidine kinase